MLKARVHRAKVMDYEGIKPLLRCADEAFPRLSHLWLDAGYKGEDKGGDEIPLAARIVAAVDAYDVMLRGRPYRPNRYRPKSSPAEALNELRREAGHQFDVRVVEAMGQLLSDPKSSASDSP